MKWKWIKIGWQWTQQQEWSWNEKEHVGSKREQSARFTVLAVLAITAIVVAMVVHSEMRASQQNNFEAAFESDSLNVLDSFHKSIGRMLDSGDALSTAYTSHML